MFAEVFFFFGMTKTDLASEELTQAGYGWIFVDMFCETLITHKMLCLLAVPFVFWGFRA